MVIRFREDYPNLLEYICAPPPENSKLIGEDGIINAILQENLFKKLEPLEEDMRRCVIQLVDLEEIPNQIVERMKDDDDKKFMMTHPKSWDQFMECAASIVPEIEEINDYLAAQVADEPTNLWQFVTLLAIGGSLKGEGEIQDKAHDELINVLQGLYKVYRTDTLILLRTHSDKPIWVYPWYKESKVIVH